MYFYFDEIRIFVIFSHIMHAKQKHHVAHKKDNQDGRANR